MRMINARINYITDDKIWTRENYLIYILGREK